MRLQFSPMSTGKFPTVKDDNSAQQRQLGRGKFQTVKHDSWAQPPHLRFLTSLQVSLYKLPHTPQSLNNNCGSFLFLFAAL